MAVNYLVGNEAETWYGSTSQVYKVTHKGDGTRLPFMNRSFISFSYGGKIIEDFNLVATIEGDRINQPAYASFEDVTESYDVLDGQFYWGSHYNAHEFTFTLATDGITDKELDDFKEWFSPGNTRELILAEHPNRAIMARVAAPPQLSLLPFEKKATMTVARESYETSITLYKGSIELNLVADEPHWYAKHNLILTYIAGDHANGVINLKQDARALRDLLNNNYKYADLIITFRKANTVQTELVRMKSMTIKNGYWYIDGTYWNGAISTKEPQAIRLQYPDQIIAIETGVTTWKDKDYVKIILEDNIPHLLMIKDKMFLGDDFSLAGYTDDDSESLVFSPNANSGAHALYYGFVARDLTGTFEITATSPQYLYYSGTAPARPKLTFTLTPQLNSRYYVVEPRNKYTTNIDKIGYTYIALDDKKFYFSSPSIVTGYNQALSIVAGFSTNAPISDIYLAIKEGVSEYYSRAWAIFCMQQLESAHVSDGKVKSTFFAAFTQCMQYFFRDDNNKITSMKFSFDSKTGEATGIFNVRVAQSGKAYNSTGLIQQVEENVGDMVKSDYLIIEGRNYPNVEGLVTIKECHKVSTNYATGLKDVMITFKNMYL